MVFIFEENRFLLDHMCPKDEEQQQMETIIKSYHDRDHFGFFKYIKMNRDSIDEEIQSNFVR